MAIYYNFAIKGDHTTIKILTNVNLIDVTLDQLKLKLNSETLYMCMSLASKIMQLDIDPNKLDSNFIKKLIQIYDNTDINDVLEGILVNYNERRILTMAKKFIRFFDTLMEGKESQY